MVNQSYAHLSEIKFTVTEICMMLDSDAAKCAYYHFLNVSIVIIILCGKQKGEFIKKNLHT